MSGGATVVAGLAVSAYVHSDLAAGYDLVGNPITLGALFRVQAASALVIASWVLLRGSRVAVLAAAILSTASPSPAPSTSASPRSVPFPPSTNPSGTTRKWSPRSPPPSRSPGPVCSWRAAYACGSDPAPEVDLARSDRIRAVPSRPCASPPSRLARRARPRRDDEEGARLAGGDRAAGRRRHRLPRYLLVQLPLLRGADRGGAVRRPAAPTCLPCGRPASPGGRPLAGRGHGGRAVGARATREDVRVDLQAR